MPDGAGTVANPGRESPKLSAAAAREHRVEALVRTRSEPTEDELAELRVTGVLVSGGLPCQPLRAACGVHIYGAISALRSLSKPFRVAGLRRPVSGAGEVLAVTPAAVWA